MPEDPSGEQPTLFSGSGDEPTVSLPGGLDASSQRSAGTPRLAPGQRFGPYEIKRALGRGGMGEVYEALNLESGHRVALKLLAGESAWSPERRQRFLREGRLAASVNHPHSLYIYGTEEIEGIPVISMELATGATLKDRVASRGPLPPSEAVDAALQMIDGLQAAQKTGVLHRDIKPGNCFLDHDGNVKIGDFGLATSSGGPELTQLTAPGTILGTPAYASPEQLRGDAADVRSDIYAVGGTLYFLLTGAPPFGKEAGLQLMAAILEKTPAPPHRIAPGIPVGLSRVLLRCLEKNPASRPQCYEDLRSELEPFGTQALTSARALRRFMAGLFDYAWAQVLLAAVVYYPLVRGVTARDDLLPSGLWDMPFIALCILLTGILEGVWAATPGKWLLGIRVWSAQKAVPGLGTAVARAALFWSPMILIDLLRFALGRTGILVQGGSFDFTLDAIGDVAPLVHFLRARRPTGWRGIHDRITGTRVVRRTASPAQAGSLATTVADVPVGGARLGPYLVPQDLVTSAKPGDVVSGYDPALRRKVWIQLCEAGAPPVSEARRTLSRRGRLRWLNGRRSAKLSWDAYQAEEGSSFAAEVGEPRSWAVVRQWLCGLAEELQARAGDEPSAQATLSLNRVWITADGHALLLDFLAPDTEPATGYPQSPENPQLFLSEVAHWALSGGSARVAQTDSSALPPLPLHARRFIRSLADDRALTVEGTLGQARDLLLKPATMTRKRRLGQMLVPAAPILLAMILFVFGALHNASISRRYPDHRAFQATLVRYHEIETSESLDPEVESEKRALEIVLAGPFRAGLFGDDPIPDSVMKFPHLDAEERATLERVFAAHPDPSQKEIERAEEVLAAFLAKEREPVPPGRFILAILKLVGGVCCLGLVLSAPLSLLLGLVIRGGPSGRLVGVAIVTGNGERASRARGFARGVVGWLPAILLWALVFMGTSEKTGSGTSDLLGLARAVVDVLGVATESMVFPAAVALFLVGVVWAIARPSRSLQDLVAGTYLVPE